MLRKLLTMFQRQKPAQELQVIKKPTLVVHYCRPGLELYTRQKAA